MFDTHFECLKTKTKPPVKIQCIYNFTILKRIYINSTIHSAPLTLILFTILQQYVHSSNTLIKNMN